MLCIGGFNCDIAIVCEWAVFTMGNEAFHKSGLLYGVKRKMERMCESYE